MSRNLKPGDRVHVTIANRVPGYQAGGMGTVQREIVSATQGTLFYLVAMDKATRPPAAPSSRKGKSRRTCDHPGRRET
jgi:hypothetical protein